MLDSKTTTDEIFLKLKRNKILTALERVIPWSSDAAGQDGKTLTGDELVEIRSYIKGEW